jgi:hypothetical protein
MPNIVHSQRVDSPDNRRVQVLFYDDGSYRFRIYDAPIIISEAWLPGTSGNHAIIKAEPRHRCPVCGVSAKTAHNLQTHIEGAHGMGGQ